MKISRPFSTFTFAMIALAIGLFAQTAAAQGLFRTVVTVNDLSITQFEVEQRKRLLTLLRSPGDLDELAIEGLIDDRLRFGAARRAGLELSPEEIEAGIAEFAGRANLSAEQFLAAIKAQGVSAETMRDFVSAGLVWRQLVRGRFGPRAQISESEIDRALALATGQSGARVLLSELLVPLTPQNEDQARQLMNRLSSSITTISAFASAARQYSAARTARIGGRLDWLPISNLPPQIRAQVLTLQPGEVTDPIVLGPGIGIFQLRALEETDVDEIEAQTLEYATILIPGGRSAAAVAQAEKLAETTDTCDDLYTPVKRLPPEYFDRTVAPSADIPGDIALELAKLDPNEVSTALTRQNGEFLVFLRLCGRTYTPVVDGDGTEVDQRAELRERLFQQRITSLADSYLAELRADAIIIER